MDDMGGLCKAIHMAAGIQVVSERLSDERRSDRSQRLRRIHLSPNNSYSLFRAKRGGNWVSTRERLLRGYTTDCNRIYS